MKGDPGGSRQQGDRKGRDLTQGCRDQADAGERAQENSDSGQFGGGEIQGTQGLTPPGQKLHGLLLVLN